jgi:hypothetical protein
MGVRRVTSFTASLTKRANGVVGVVANDNFTLPSLRQSDIVNQDTKPYLGLNKKTQL